MENLRTKSVVFPTEQPTFEQWFNEMRVSTVWKAQSIANRIAIDDAKSYKEEYLNTFQPTEKVSFLLKVYNQLKTIIKK